LNFEQLKEVLFPDGDPYYKIPSAILNQKNSISSDVSVRDGEIGGLFEAILDSLDCEPDILIEVGSFLGASAIVFGQIIKARKLKTKIICIDTFLGSTFHWERADRRNPLNIRNGYPMMFFDFLNNVKSFSLDGIICPFPTTSLDAAAFLQRNEVTANLTYIDSSHDEITTRAECEAYWPITRNVLFGDDFGDEWGVPKAVRGFCHSRNLKFGVRNYKWIIAKTKN